MKTTKTTFTNSAVAFFFLFFLHGFSIGNGQQGISYNVRPALRRQGMDAQKFNFAPMFNSSRMLSLPLLPCFCKTGCYMPFLLAVKILTFK